MGTNDEGSEVPAMPQSDQRGLLVATSQVSPRTRSSDMTQQARTRVPMSTRRRLARWRVTARRLSSSLRRLPDILIIGAQRCGTSSLYKYLGQHPAVIPSIRKEVE